MKMILKTMLGLEDHLGLESRLKSRDDLGVVLLGFASGLKYRCE